MKAKRRYRIILYGLGILFLAGILTACTPREIRKALHIEKEDKAAVVEAEEQEEWEEDPGSVSAADTFYLVLKNDSTEETIQLYDYSSGQEILYCYSLETSFFDKYGNITSSGNVGNGKIVTIGGVSQDGKLTRIQVTDQVWEYTDVEKFSINEDRGIFQIADTKYNWKNNLRVFSNEEQISLSDISNHDILTVTGYGKQILSIVITTGHGTLALSNTELFEDSFLQLGSRIFSRITKNMTMELPEGTYTLAVANNGWGGTQEITISRGMVTEVDLDAIKGEGPSYGTILFDVDVDTAVISVDNKQIDDSEPVSLQYGAHTLSVTAEGYETWTRTLYVNSEEATIQISLEEEDTSPEEDTESSSESEKKSEEETKSESEKDSKQDAKEDYLQDYLSTLSSLIESMT